VTEKPYNAANVEQVRERKRTEKERAEQYRDEMRKLLDMPEFRRFAWRFMNETCGILRNAANPNGSIQSINLGLQSAGIALWTEVEACDPLMIPMMMTEHYEAQK
jgi:hypothetical protein